MTGEPQDQQDIVWTEALDWLLRLNAPEHNVQDAAEFAAWLNQSDAHRDAYQQAKHVWTLTGALTPPAGHGASQPHMTVFERQASKEDIRGAPTRRGLEKPMKRRRAAFVAALIAASILLLVAAPQIGLLLRADYRTTVGGGQDVQLADGTEISLNAQSAIAVNYTDKSRQVTLLAGEAFIKVAPDSSRPFSLVSGNLTVSDIGTVFDVDAKSSSLTIGVQDGQVAADYDHVGQKTRTLLNKDDRLRIDLTTGKGELKKIDGAQIGAWRSGLLLVDAATIGDVVEELQRFHRGLILLRDRDLAQQRVSGVYDLKNPIHALRAAVEPYAGVVQQWTPHLITVSAAPALADKQ